jgi:hypothetical protein
MADKYVFSTLSSDQAYSVVKSRADGSYDIVGSVLIRGGANVADKHFVTPRGVMTRITEDEFKAIENDTSFILHVANGYLKYEDAPADVEKVVADMEGRDQSAPLTPNDFGDNDPEAAQPTADAPKKRGRKAE